MKDTKTVLLPNMLLKLLKYLIVNPNRTLTRDELAIHMSPVPGSYSDAALDKNVERLRRELGDSAKDPSFIETIPGKGIRFIAQVTEVPIASPPPVPPPALVSLEELGGIRFDGGSIICAFREPVTVHAYTRATYRNISETHFTWRGEKSEDGKTWKEFIAVEVRRSKE